MRFAQVLERSPLKPSELAEKIGKSAATITQWKSGTTKMIEADNLLRACQALNARPEYIMFGVGPMWAEKEIDSQYSYEKLSGPSHEKLPPIKAESGSVDLKDIDLVLSGLSLAELAVIMRATTETLIKKSGQ
ncbi:hypothetical protein VI06_03390 [Aquitalea magnusonii]|nr:hypothetical protein VI06_03390 [Aquitalea magnusonii]